MKISMFIIKRSVVFHAWHVKHNNVRIDCDLKMYVETFQVKYIFDCNIFHYRKGSY